MPFILALDQGTTPSRAILFRDDMTVAASAQPEFSQQYPAAGWVEQEPADIYATQLCAGLEPLATAAMWCHGGLVSTKML